MSIEEDVRNAVLKYSDMLYKVCIVILCNEQDVQDAIQDFYNHEDRSLYKCMIDTVDGSILYIDTNETIAEE